MFTWVWFNSLLHYWKTSWWLFHQQNNWRVVAPVVGSSRTRSVGRQVLQLAWEASGTLAFVMLQGPMENVASLGENRHFLTNQFSTTCHPQLCFDYTIIYIFFKSTWMGCHFKWVDVSISLVSVQQWPLTGVDHQNIFKNKI